MLEFITTVKEHKQAYLICNETFDKSIYAFEEDIFLSGFSPFAHIITKSAHMKSIPDETSQFKARLNCIESLGSSFVNNGKERNESYQLSAVRPAFNSDVIKGAEEDDEEDFNNVEIEEDFSRDEELDNVSITEQIDANKNKMLANALNSHLSNNNTNNNDDDDSDDWDDQVSQLAKLKKQLEAKNQAKRFYNNRIVEIMRDIDTKLYIEVKPKYLLPDTNCFIDCLENFQHIIKEFKHYVLVVPLTGNNVNVIYEDLCTVLTLSHNYFYCSC